MRRSLIGLKWALSAAAVVGYPLLLHAAAAQELGEPARTAVAIGPILLAGIWLAAVSRYRWWWLAGSGLAVAAVAFLQGRHIDVSVAYGVPHAAAYLFLLSLFGRSLLAGREALVTRFARRIHGGLPPELVSYTRRVTWAWCLFSAANLATSALLYLFAPVAAWSLFVNVLNFPLLILMFVAEYVWRILRYPDFTHSSIFKGAQLLSQLDAPASEAAERR
jgi:uncharacterized membrane protein